MSSKAVVSAARNDRHTADSVARALRDLLDNLDVPLSTLVKRGDRVLIKVNMGCSGHRDPELRLTTHPTMVEAIIKSLLDCGAVVSFGDDVSRSGKHSGSISERTGMSEVARRTGAKLIDFVAAGAREVRGGLLYPRTYLVTNAYFDADVVINAASCRSGPVVVGMSAAVKNMFGCVVGLRKQLIHNLFDIDPPQFGHAIADIHRVVQADLSFLDLTSVAEAGGITLAVRPVGLMLASTDPVALDTVAAHAIGYEDLPIWTSYYGNKIGLGCNDIGKIGIRGLDWDLFEKRRLQYPFIRPVVKRSPYDRVSRAVNNTLLRPRPVVTASKCTGCGDCAQRCPVSCIEPAPNNVYRINLNSCVDCGCCVKVCDAAAVQIEFVGLAKTVRHLLGKQIAPVIEDAPV